MRHGPLVLVALLSGCQPEPPQSPNEQMDKLLEVTDVTRYAARCKAELGLPEDTLPPMNCLDGVEIPVTTHGERPTEEQFEQMREGLLGCDNPSWIGDGEPCANYSFIVTRQLSEDVIAVLFCRQREVTSRETHGERLAAYELEPSAARFRDLFSFDSLGLIWTNTRTGGTCFFDRVADIYGGYIAMPDDLANPSYDDLPAPRPPDDVDSDYWRRNAKTLWVPPSRTASSDMCVGCHSAGPFIRAGHVRALGVVPTVGPNVPYSLVGEVGAHQQAQMPPLAVSTSPVEGPDGPEPQACTTCHRIGLGPSCERFTRYYTGQLEQPGLVDGLPFHHRVLMPPPSPTAGDDDDATQADDWSQRYQRHVDKLSCCCDDPTAVGCTTQDITQSPLPEPIDGAGPASCEDLTL